MATVKDNLRADGNYSGPAPYTQAKYNNHTYYKSGGHDRDVRKDRPYDSADGLFLLVLSEKVGTIKPKFPSRVDRIGNDLPASIAGVRQLHMLRNTILMAVVACSIFAGSVLAGTQVLTKADISADLSPQLRGLIEQTFSSDFRVRKSAAKQLGEMQERASPAIPFLIRLLADRDLDDTGFKWQYYADDALVAIGEPALDACIKAANDPSSMVQVYAVECLTKFDSPRAGDALIKILQSNSNVSDFAITCFSIRRDPRSVKPLLKTLEVSPSWFIGDNRIRHVPAIEALGFQKDARAIPKLLKFLQDPEENVWLRHATAHSLGMISDPSVYPILVDVFQDRTAPVILRSGAALGIGQYRPNEKHFGDAGKAGSMDKSNALSLLSNSLNDKKEPLELRMAVARAMGDLGNQDTVQLLTPVVDAHKQDNLGFWAAVSIVKLTDGATRDVDVVSVIKDYYEASEVNGLELMEQHIALEKIEKNGKWPARLALADLGWLVKATPVVGGAIGIALVLFIIRKFVLLPRACASQGQET